MEVFSYWSLRMFAIALVLIGAFNWILFALGWNLVERININLGHLFGKRFVIDRVIYFLVGVSALVLAFDRTLWLPFLGEAVLPSALVPTKDHSGKEKIKVRVSPNTKVAYWAAMPKSIDDGANKEDPTVEVAYDNYSNSGVVMSDANGDAILSFDKGTEYIVPGGKHLGSHVHYRELKGEYGLIGPVRTLFV